jgi:hypothetical protein
LGGVLLIPATCASATAPDCEEMIVKARSSSDSVRKKRLSDISFLLKMKMGINWLLG